MDWVSGALFVSQSNIVLLWRSPMSWVMGDVSRETYFVIELWQRLTRISTLFLTVWNLQFRLKMTILISDYFFVEDGKAGMKSGKCFAANRMYVQWSSNLGIQLIGKANNGVISGSSDDRCSEIRTCCRITAIREVLDFRQWCRVRWVLVYVTISNWKEKSLEGYKVWQKLSMQKLLSISNRGCGPFLWSAKVVDPIRLLWSHGFNQPKIHQTIVNCSVWDVHRVRNELIWRSVASVAVENSLQPPAETVECGTQLESSAAGQLEFVDVGESGLIGLMHIEMSPHQVFRCLADLAYIWAVGPPILEVDDLQPFFARYAADDLLAHTRSRSE